MCANLSAGRAGSQCGAARQRPLHPPGLAPLPAAPASAAAAEESTSTTSGLLPLHCRLLQAGAAPHAARKGGCWAGRVGAACLAAAVLPPLVFLSAAGAADAAPWRLGPQRSQRRRLARRRRGRLRLPPHNSVLLLAQPGPAGSWVSTRQCTRQQSAVERCDPHAQYTQMHARPTAAAAAAAAAVRSLLVWHSHLAGRGRARSHCC